MGPTASGKTDLAVRLSQQFPLDIISVDSAMVYKGMDIGTAKPDATLLQSAPHRLIDVAEPEQPYSAGMFVTDARREMAAIHASGRIPLLVGGTMLYFRSLIEGIANLPDANPTIRQQIDREAAALGWPAMHAQLAEIDPRSGGRIAASDRQRIQRALEVYRVSGRTLTEWQAQPAPALPACRFVKIALMDDDRTGLHLRINQRFDDMMAAGFLDEVQTLMQRPGLSAESSSMRAVGYRQLWAHLAGHSTRDEAVARAQAATRQLAKRQFTWLRSESGLARFDPLEVNTADTISTLVAGILNE
jgi:tRNA dimethylallyltransferase